MTNLKQEHLIKALVLLNNVPSKKWPNVEACAYHIAEALGLPDHDMTEAAMYKFLESQERVDMFPIEPYSQED